MYHPPNNLTNRTYFSNLPITAVVSKVFARNNHRTGYVLINRTAGAIVYIGASQDMLATSSSVIRLLENEILTILEIEGDDAEHEVYALSTINAVLEIVESLMI